MLAILYVIELMQLSLYSEAKLVTTPAYMLGQNLLEVGEGLDKMVQAVFAMQS